MTMRAGKSLFVAAVSTVVLCLLTVAPTAASAHDELVTSSPKNGATLAALPKSVVLHFEEAPAEGYTKVRLVNAAGNTVSKAAPVTVGSTVTLALPKSSATGNYKIVWSLLSDDGHPVSGTIAFKVAATTAKKVAVAPATSQVAAKTTHSGGAGLGWLAAALIGAAVLAAVFLLSDGRKTA